MAKGKHSTALFEVIHSTKRPEVAAQRLRTPKWWFKGGQAGKSDAAAPQATESTAPRAAETAAFEPPAEPHFGPRDSSVQLGFDRDRKQITFRLRYTTALVGAFGVCVVIGLAYVLGRHLGHGPASASAEVTQYRQMPVHSGVLDPVHPQPVRAPVAPEHPQHNTEFPAPQTSRQHQTPSLVPAGAETRLPRTIGLQYVLVQSYPKEKKELAQEAADYLTRRGVPATVESVPYLAQDWWCVVGTAGFTKASSSECQSYMETIARLGVDSPGSKFDHFGKGYAFRWRGQVDR